MLLSCCYFIIWGNRQHRKFDATQLKALKENLPTAEERQGIMMYMKKGESDPAVKEQLYKDFSECEKYMYTIAEVPKAAEKFDCMLFRNQFKVRFEDLLESISTVEQACNETKQSERLRQMMATILTLVNQINTGGEGGKEAAGFSLEGLLKLNEVWDCFPYFRWYSYLASFSPFFFSCYGLFPFY